MLMRKATNKQLQISMSSMFLRTDNEKPECVLLSTNKNKYNGFHN